MDRYKKWWEKYSQLRSLGKSKIGQEYSLKAYDTFPRYLLLQSILLELEKLDSDYLPDLDATKDLIINIAETAEFQYTEVPTEIAKWAIHEERENFYQVVNEFEENVTVEPLFYRRILGKNEKAELMENLQLRWGIRAHVWYPTISVKAPSIIAFPYDTLLSHVPQRTMLSQLLQKNVQRVYEIHQTSQLSYCLSTDVLKFQCDKENVIWTSDGFDWVIFLSLEKIITIGGWMSDKIKEIWSGWEQYKM